MDPVRRIEPIATGMSTSTDTRKESGGEKPSLNEVFTGVKGVLQSDGVSTTQKIDATVRGVAYTVTGGLLSAGIEGILAEQRIREKNAETAKERGKRVYRDATRNDPESHS